MFDFSRTHAALFDGLERQGIYCADVVKLAKAVMDAAVIIDPPRTAQPYLRCEACE